jgi:GntR family transcriptional regulator, trigonelline degradation regulator
VAVVALKTAVATPLRQQVVEILRAAITECEFEPGGRLIERELCESLGVSRSTVREGLSRLEAEGLVRITPNKGPVVTMLDETEAVSTYEIRGALEGLASALCARTANPVLVERLGAHLARMKQAVQTENFTALQRAKTGFYDCLYEASGNPQLVTMLKQLRARVTLIRGLDIERGERMRESVDGARRILTAIRSRAPDRARREAEEHIRRAAALAIEAMHKVNTPVENLEPRSGRRSRARKV